jgi:hypothetical protein
MTTPQMQQARKTIIEFLDDWDRAHYEKTGFAKSPSQFEKQRQEALRALENYGLP